MKRITSIPDYIAFSHSHKGMTDREYFLFCREGVALLLELKFPPEKKDIAYEIVSHGGSIVPRNEKVKECIEEIRNYARFLEVPDTVVYTGDELSIKRQWQLMASYVQDGLELTS